MAYIANQFPSPVEPYVMQEINELRQHGIEVIPCSARRPGVLPEENEHKFAGETLYLQPFRLGRLVCAVWLCVGRRALLRNLFSRVLRGPESPSRQMRALFHTCLGAYYALLLRGRRVQHIHVHHGYFASWVAMVAARLSGISFSMTLHGSDLLLHRAYLDIKLQSCKFCITVSEFNRRHILEQYPDVDPNKVLVLRMGIDALPGLVAGRAPERKSEQSIMLAVGRLHPVKDHAFLVRACHKLKDRGMRFLCLIAGDGPERQALERLIHDLHLQEEVKLLGHLSRQKLDACYTVSDLVVLTSQSEGIPLVLMEAMAHSKPVLAPAITGIPELVLDTSTGFTYQPGSIEDFVERCKMICDSQSTLGPLRRAARQHVLEHFHREKNLAAFAQAFLARIAGSGEARYHADSLL